MSRTGTDKQANIIRDLYIKEFGEGRIEQYNKRNIAGTNIPSAHSWGGALDLFGGDLKAKAEWATRQKGVKNVIYNRKIWTPAKGWRRYTGQDPHTGHVHVEA